MTAAFHLFTGPEELLLRRAAEEVLDRLRAAGPVEVTDLRASEIGDSGFPDVRTTSLFGTPRALLLREAHELTAPSVAALGELVAAPPDATTVILLARNTTRFPKLAKQIAAVGEKTEVAPPKDWEDKRWEAFVVAEFARHGRKASAAAVTALLAHAGLDVAGIAEKTAQAVAATAPDKVVGPEDVERVVVGHGSRGSFAIADAMCDRRPAEALALLRGALESGDDPVLILGALVYRLRSIVAVAGRIEPRSVGLGISAGQARRLQAVRRNFGAGELTAAYRVLADADREIKGGELPPELVLERAVARIASPGFAA